MATGRSCASANPLGAIATFLQLAKTEASEQYKTRAVLHTVVRQLDVATGTPRHRGKAFSHLGRTSLLPLHLPQGFLRIIASYADTTGISKNEALDMFLERGFIMYVKGENILLSTILALRKEQAATRRE